MIRINLEAPRYLHHSEWLASQVLEEFVEGPWMSPGTRRIGPGPGSDDQPYQEKKWSWEMFHHGWGYASKLDRKRRAKERNDA